MDVIITEINRKNGLREFIHLPSKIHGAGSCFIPPLYRDEWKFHDRTHNKNLALSDVVYFMATKNNRPAGRVMGIIYHPWNTRERLRDARFFQFDSIEDRETASRLMHAVEMWARSKGMDRMIGPFGFSDKDPQGMQVEGFEFAPVIAANVNEPYLPGLLTGLGYVPFKDCVSYSLDIPESLPESYQRIARRLKARESLQMITFNNRQSLKPWLLPVMQLMNRAYRSIYGFMPLEAAEMEELARQYLPVLDPRLVKVIADMQNNPVAFIIAMPNISEGFRKANGRLFPIGFVHLLRALRTSKRLDLLLGGIDDHYRGRGLNVLLGIEIFREAKRMQLHTLDSHLILEENKLMRAELEKLGGTLYKRYRIYTKTL